MATDGQRLGAEALILDRLDLALLRARAGVHLHDSAATRSNLPSVVRRSPAALGVLPAHEHYSSCLDAAVLDVGPIEFRAAPIRHNAAARTDGTAIFPDPPPDARRGERAAAE